MTATTFGRHLAFGSRPGPARADPTDPLARGWIRVLFFVGAAAAAALAIASGLTVLAGGSKSELVTPLAVGFGVILGILAITRFKAYVLLLIVVRASVDMARVSGRTAGSTTTTGAAKAGDPSTILALVLIVTAAVWLLAQYRREGHLPGDRIRQALVLFFVAGLLSLLASPNVGPSAVEALRILAVVMTYVVVEQLARGDRARRQLVVAAIASSIFPLLVVAEGFATGKPRSELKGSYTRIVGTFTQSNDFAIYLMFLIIMGVAIYPHLSKRWRLVMSAMIVGWAGCCMLTYTRSALLGVVLGLIVIGLLQSKRILIMLVAAAVATLVVLPPLAGRFASLTKSQDLQVVNGHVAQNNNSVTWRIGYWAQIIPLANRSPVIGIGLAQTRYSTSKTKQPHNDYVRSYVETGLAGLGAYVFLQLMLLRTSNRARKAVPRGTWDYGVAVGALGCCVAFFAVSLVANVISSVVNVVYLLTFVAAAVGPMLPGALPAAVPDIGDVGLVPVGVEGA